ncbi:GON-4-like protein [Cheilinus undulatus]|uniref:GON-4-like protein n=1 Tax=Cheilinus undulatus TaxID=241271 RepID=UPI001BD67E08|nr:GON-4-like protein [Cheilinus undulatus]
MSAGISLTTERRRPAGEDICSLETKCLRLDAESDVSRRDRKSRTGNLTEDGQDEERTPGSVTMETSDYSDDELGRLDIDLDRKSKQHNLTSSNVRAILHEVITHERVVAMMKATIRDTQDLPMFEPKMTRSRLRQVIQQGQSVDWSLSGLDSETTKLPQFVDIELEDDEDSSDEEYCPDEDEEEDTAEETFFSDGDSLTSPPRAQLHLQDQLRISSHTPEIRLAVPDSSFLERLNAVEQELDSSPTYTYNQSLEGKNDDDIDDDGGGDDAGCHGDKGSLAYRTRSKLRLVNVPLGQLEAELLAPDITADMYEQGRAQRKEDRHWTRWLQGLMGPDNEEDADDEDDPEYNFLEDMDEPDVEDYRTDRGVQITKKEVNELLDELFDTLQDDQSEEQEAESDPIQTGTNFNVPKALRFEAPLASMLTERRRVVRQQYEAVQQKRALQDTTNQQRHSTHLNSTPAPQSSTFTPLLMVRHTSPALHLNATQKLQLQQQVQQHVQLLTQIHLLARRVDALHHETSITKHYLEELQQFARRQEEFSRSSSFRVCNLKGALDLLQDAEHRLVPPPAPPAPASSKRWLPAMTQSTNSLAFPLLPADLAWIFATRPVFLYPELLPISSLDAASSRQQRNVYTAGEDGLIVLALKHFEGTVEPDQLISSYLIRKTRWNFRKHVREMSGARAPPNNIIKVFLTQKVIPPLPLACCRILPDDQRPPVDRDISNMPNWLKNSQLIIQKTRLDSASYPPSLPPGVTLRLHPYWLSKSRLQAPQHKRIFKLAHNASLPPLAKAPVDRQVELMAPPLSKALVDGQVDLLAPPLAKSPKDRQVNLMAPSPPGVSEPPVVPYSEAAVPLAAVNSGSAHITTSSIPFGQRLQQSSSTPLLLPLPPLTYTDTTNPMMPCSTAALQPGYILMVWTPPTAYSLPAATPAVHLEHAVTRKEPIIEEQEETLARLPTTPEEGIARQESPPPPPPEERLYGEERPPPSPEGPDRQERPPPSPPSVERPDGQEGPPSPPEDGSTLKLVPKKSYEVQNGGRQEDEREEDGGEGREEDGGGEQEENRGEEREEREEDGGGEQEEDGGGEQDEDGGGEREDDGEKDEDQQGDEEEEEDFDDLTQDEDEEEVMSSASEESVLSVPELQETMKQLTWLAAEQRLCADGDSEEDHSPTSPGSQEEEEEEEEEGPKCEESGNGRRSKEAGEEDARGEGTQRGGGGRRGRGRSRPLRGLRRSRQERHSVDTAKLLLLYDEHILDNDPHRESKDAAFAQSYLNRVREALQDLPGQVGQFVSLLSEFEQARGQEVVMLFRKLRCILGDHTDLLRDFAAFLQPEQALLCGLFEEQQAFERSRRFLRQLEISFGENPSHYQKIIKALQTGPDLSPSSIQELKSQMAMLLKGHTLLQNEFWVFFEELRPPPAHPGQFEEAHWPDEGGGGVEGTEGFGQVSGGRASGGFEEVTLPELEEEEEGQKVPPITSRRQRRKMAAHRNYKDCDWLEKDWACLCPDSKIRRHRRKGCSRCHGNKMSGGVSKAMKSLDPLYAQISSAHQQSGDREPKGDSPKPDRSNASWEGSYSQTGEKEEELEEELDEEEDDDEEEESRRSEKEQSPTVKRRRVDETLTSSASSAIIITSAICSSSSFTSIISTTTSTSSTVASSTTTTSSSPISSTTPSNPPSSTNLPSLTSPSNPPSSTNLPSLTSPSNPPSSTNLPTSISPSNPASSTNLPSSTSPSNPASSTSLPSFASPSNPPSSTNLPTSNSPSNPASSTNLPSSTSPSNPASSTNLLSSTSPSKPASSTNLPSSISPSNPASSTNLPSSTSPSTPASPTSLPSSNPASSISPSNSASSTSPSNPPSSTSPSNPPSSTSPSNPPSSTSPSHLPSSALSPSPGATPRPSAPPELAVCAQNISLTASGEKVILWTREADRVILTTCQQEGANQNTFQAISTLLGNKTPSEVARRFQDLMCLFRTSARQVNPEDEAPPTEPEADDKD